MPFQTSLAFVRMQVASSDKLPSKSARCPKPLSLCPWIMVRQVVALKGWLSTTISTLSIIWEVLAKPKSECWKSVESVKELGYFLDPQGAHLQSWRSRFPSIFATCEQWQLMNPSLIHLIEGISIWERWDAFFTLCERVHVFVIQLRLQGQSGNVLAYRWSAMRVSAMADIYNNVAYGLFILWKTNNTQRSYKSRLYKQKKLAQTQVPRIKRLTFLRDDTMLVVGPHSVNILKHPHHHNHLLFNGKLEGISEGILRTTQ